MNAETEEATEVTQLKRKKKEKEQEKKGGKTKKPLHSLALNLEANK